MTTTTTTEYCTIDCLMACPKDKSRVCRYINVRELYPNSPLCPEVTDEMIEHYLETKSEEKCQDPHEIYAQRIARLINLMRNGVVKIDKISICYNKSNKTFIVEDEWPRMRAAYYLNLDIPFWIYSWDSLM